VRLDGKVTPHRSSNRLDLGFRNRRCTPSRFHDHAGSGCAQDLDSLVKPCAEKYIAGKQREPKLLHPILPSVDGPIERQKNQVALTFQNPSHSFLVLVAGIQRVPRQVDTLNGCQEVFLNCGYSFALWLTHSSLTWAVAICFSCERQPQFYTVKREAEWNA
jgi:hypothetical protein